MKLYTGSQIRNWDRYTITNEPITSTALMERAAGVFVEWFCSADLGIGLEIKILCGNGNNGGDGLVIARMLHERKYSVSVFVYRISNNDSDDFDINLAKCLSVEGLKLEFLHDKIPDWGQGTIVIDALLGTGVTRRIEGFAAELIESVNGSGNQVVSVDMPSGLPTEGLPVGIAVFAEIVFTFMQPKLSFFNPENERYIASWVAGDIGLHPGYEEDTETSFLFTDKKLISSWHMKRSKFSHKSQFGHVLICGGNYGKTGAVILASRAAMRTGAGLVTACVPKDMYTSMHAAVPEVMATDTDILVQSQSDKSRLSIYSAIGVGPGMGKEAKELHTLRYIMEHAKSPLVLDADALNIISEHPELLALIPENTILTPHPGEFKRLFGSDENTVAMFEKHQNIARKYGVIIVLKGAYSRIATPYGKVYINSTGNSGMATAGSGDVLTGVITALLAQGYPPEKASVMGVYLHGLAGDFALQQQSPESLCASDITQFMGSAFASLDV